MIECRVETERGLLRTLESTGHGNINNSNARISVSCAAVSTLIRSFGRLLEERTDVIVEVERFSPGDIMLRVQHVDERAEQWFRGLTDMLTRGLADVRDDFPGEVHLDSSQRL